MQTQSSKPKVQSAFLRLQALRGYIMIIYIRQNVVVQDLAQGHTRDNTKGAKQASTPGKMHSQLHLVLKRVTLLFPQLQGVLIAVGKSYSKFNIRKDRI